MEEKTTKTLKILFLGGDTADYLNVGVLLGLHSLDYVDLIEYPCAEVLYESNSIHLRKHVRGNAFTLFFLLKEKFQKRFHLIFDEIPNKVFDLIIIGDIHNSFGYLLQFLPYLNIRNTIILDGSDSPSIFPYNGKYWRIRSYWFLPSPHKHFLYFKREWTPETIYYRWYKIIPNIFQRYLPAPKNLREISFSIPEEKIVKTLPSKTKMFPKHIVDTQVCCHVDGSYSTYAFENEEDYYKDLQESKFGITTKRAGWDCMRHYEIAANGAVICFKDLDKKPSTCAPHGLIAGVNCLIYTHYEDLMVQVSAITQEAYEQLQIASIEWAKSNSCRNRAIQIIQSLNLP